MANIYDFSVQVQDGRDFSLAAYEGQVLLVVNTATGCGLTPQYEALQNLYDRYQDQGFEILDFPCNQFMNQAPGTDAEINEFCTLNYATTFPRFKKIDVNGAKADPLYTWLKQEKGGKLGAAIKWNFSKFLLDRTGQVVKRYAPTTLPEEIEADIQALL